MYLQMYVGLHVKCPYCCPVLTKISVCQRSLVKLPNAIFHENMREVSVATREQKQDRCLEANRQILQLFVANAPRIHFAFVHVQKLDPVKY
jgi:hypothetical protein